LCDHFALILSAKLLIEWLDKFGSAIADQGRMPKLLLLTTVSGAAAPCAAATTGRDNTSTNV
jgi:hypothetical protein